MKTLVVWTLVVVFAPAQNFRFTVFGGMTPASEALEDYKE